MNIDDIKLRIKAIKRMSHDPELAHAAEDETRVSFIEHIASFENPCQAMAKEVLKTSKIKFSRWFA